MYYESDPVLQMLFNVSIELVNYYEYMFSELTMILMVVWVYV